MVIYTWKDFSETQCGTAPAERKNRKVQPFPKFPQKQRSARGLAGWPPSNMIF